MDSSITRRGQLCWYLSPAPKDIADASITSSGSYKHPLVGTIAINDAFLLEGAIFQLLKKYFRGDPCYLNILELFHDCTYKTELGQLVDLLTAPEGDVDLSRFSLERYAYPYHFEMKIDSPLPDIV